MIHELFKKWNADWDHFRELLRISLLTEWRQQSSTTGKKQRIPILLRSLIFYFIMGFSLGISLVSRISPSLYTLLCYSYFMMMTGFAVILECSQVLMIPDDLDIIGHRPVSSSTFFLARVSHLLIFILIFSSILCIGPTVVSCFINNTNHTFPIIFWIAALLAVLFVAAVMISAYTALLRLIKFEKLRSLVMVIQLIFAGVLVFLYQWIARTGWESSVTIFRLENSWLRWLPPGWFAAIVESFIHPSSFRMPVLSLATIVISVLVLILGFRRLSLNYLQDIAQQELTLTSVKNRKHITKDRSFPISMFISSIIRHPETRASFFWTFQLLRRDRSVKMTLLPVLVPPLVILIWGIIEKDILDPFKVQAFVNGTNSMQLLPFFIAFLMFMTIHGSAYIHDWEARWIIECAPMTSSANFRKGVRFALFIGVISPFYLVLFVLFSTHFSFLHAFQHTVYLLTLGLLFLSFLSIRNKELPFSKKREKGERIGGMSFLLFLIPFQIAAVFLQLIAYKNQTHWLISLAGLFIVWRVLEKFGRRQTDKRLMINSGN